MSSRLGIVQWQADIVLLEIIQHTCEIGRRRLGNLDECVHDVRLWNKWESFQVLEVFSKFSSVHVTGLQSKLILNDHKQSARMTPLKYLQASLVRP